MGCSSELRCRSMLKWESFYVLSALFFSSSSLKFRESLRRAKDKVFQSSLNVNCFSFAAVRLGIRLPSAGNSDNF